jgi:hypothetical protein
MHDLSIMSSFYFLRTKNIKCSICAVLRKSSHHYAIIGRNLTFTIRVTTVLRSVKTWRTGTTRHGLHTEVAVLCSCSESWPQGRKQVGGGIPRVCFQNRNSHTVSVCDLISWMEVRLLPCGSWGPVIRHFHSSHFVSFTTPKKKHHLSFIFQDLSL